MKKVFIVHGWAYNLDRWDGLIKELKARNIEPILLKVPGLTEPSNAVWDIDGYVGWLKRKLAGSPKPVVIGHSNGGRIALALDQKYPGIIGKLILIDSAGLAHNETGSKAKLRTLRVIAKAGKPLAKLPNARRAFYKLVGARDYFEASPNMRLTMQNMLRADKQINLAMITTSVTMIWGRNDAITPLKDGLKMQKLLGNPPIHIIEDARHSPHSNHPEKIATIIAKVMVG